MFTPDDVAFLKACGIHVDEEDIDEAYELNTDEKLTYDQALSLLNTAMQRKRRELGCDADPEMGDPVERLKVN